ncbi:MAG: hypothetical protein KDJ32_11010, partial [Alphaproteobacteria bacterium]|nr:hypothetical protein [Alphaproteobacteria bacterium]
MTIFRLRLALYICFISCFFMAENAALAKVAGGADSQEESFTQTERLSFAKEFLTRMRRGFATADKFLQNASPATKSG